MMRRLGVVTACVLVAGALAGCGKNQAAPADAPECVLGDHPQVRFPLCNGPHTADCAGCHVARLGDDPRLNISCVDCHDVAAEDTRHASMPQYAQAQSTRGPSFCLYCHPSGRI